MILWHIFKSRTLGIFVVFWSHLAGADATQQQGHRPHNSGIQLELPAFELAANVAVAAVDGFRQREADHRSRLGAARDL